MRASAKRELGQAVITGWMGERLAREQRLQGLKHYMSEFLNPALAEDVSVAMAEAELARMAAGWGLSIEDVDEEAEPSYSAAPT
jgi:hypothetical protein